MAYKTCENCGTKLGKYGCPNCDEMNYISMQDDYVPMGERMSNLSKTLPVTPDDKPEGSYYFPLFKFFNEEHNLVLMDSEIQEIIHQVNKFNEQHKPD